MTESTVVQEKTGSPAVHNKCLICNNTAIKDLQGFEHKGLVKCSGCGFVFMKRIPSQKELHDYYSVYAYQQEKNMPEPTRVSLEGLIDQFEKYRKNNRMLDVGCGEGWILELAKKRGWEVYGTEFSDRAIEICRQKGIKMYEGVLDPAKIAERDFDVIISSETIEHINNPQQELKSMHQLLRKGGLIYITTPNFNSYLRRWLKDRFHIITYPEHLSYYTRSTLNKLLRSQGFKKDKLLTTGISISHYEISTKKDDQPRSKSTDEKIRTTFSKSPVLKIVKKVVNRGLTVFGLGMTLKAYYIKM